MNPPGLAEVERTQLLIEKGPVTFVAALFAVCFLFTAYMLLRAKDRHRLDMSQLEREHAEKLATVYREAKEQAIRLEVTLHGVLEMMPDLQFIAFALRQKAAGRKTPTGVHEALIGPTTKEK